MKKSWQEEPEVAGDLVITGRQQSVTIAIDGSTFLLFIFRRTPETVPPTFRAGSSHPDNLLQMR